MVPIFTQSERVNQYTVTKETEEGVIQVFHCEDGPAYVYFWENGQKKLEIWYINGLRHKEDAPAVVEYYENGQIMEKQWYIQDQQHRTDGPAWIYYDENGNILVEYYFQNNLLFREDNLPTIVNHQ